GNDGFLIDLVDEAVLFLYFPGHIARELGIGKSSAHAIKEVFVNEIAAERNGEDRKSTRLNSSHLVISYAVFCLKKKIKYINNIRSLRNKHDIHLAILKDFFLLSDRAEHDGVGIFNTAFLAVAGPRPVCA